MFSAFNLAPALLACPVSTHGSFVSEELCIMRGNYRQITDKRSSDLPTMSFGLVTVFYGEGSFSRLDKVWYEISVRLCLLHTRYFEKILYAMHQQYWEQEDTIYLRRGRIFAVGGDSDAHGIRVYLLCICEFKTTNRCALGKSILLNHFMDWF